VRKVEAVLQASRTEEGGHYGLPTTLRAALLSSPEGKLGGPTSHDGPGREGNCWGNGGGEGGPALPLELSYLGGENGGDPSYPTCNRRGKLREKKWETNFYTGKERDENKKKKKKSRPAKTNTHTS